MTISPLADLPDAIETLAQWFYDEWHAFDGRRMENIATQLSENLNRDFMPITFVAHRNRLRLAPSLLTVSTSRRLIISHRGSALCMFIPPFAAGASEAVLFATSSTLPSHMELVLSTSGLPAPRGSTSVAVGSNLHPRHTVRSALN